MSRLRALLYLLALVLVTVAVTYGVSEYFGKRKADAAILQAAKLEGQRDAAVAAKVAKDAESEALRVKADTQAQAAKADGATIANLKGALARLRAQRPGDVPPTPIENAQDDVVSGQDAQIGHLEGAVADYQGALAAKTEAEAACGAALQAETGRADILASALKNIPKSRPWSAGLLCGKDNKGATKPGAFGGRSFGPIRVEVVVVPHFTGAGVGYSW